MFGIGFSEIVVIGLILVIFIRPDDLPGFLRAAGRAWGRIRKTVNEMMAFKEEFLRQVNAASSLEEEKDKDSGQGSGPAKEAGAEADGGEAPKTGPV